MIHKQVSEKFGCVNCHCDKYCTMRINKDENECPKYKPLAQEKCVDACVCQKEYNKCMFDTQDPTECTTVCP